MTRQDLDTLRRSIETRIVQAPNDLEDGSGTIYLKLNEFKEQNGDGWEMLRSPFVLEDGSLLAILVRIDPDR